MHTNYGVTTDYEYSSTHKRERLAVWSGPFASVYEGEAFTLPKRDGYMVTTYNGDRVRVTCPTPRTDENFTAVDAAVGAALDAYETQRGTVRLSVPANDEILDADGTHAVACECSQCVEA